MNSPFPLQGKTPRYIVQMPKNISKSRKESKKILGPKPLRSMAPVSVGYQPPKPQFRAVPTKEGCAAYAGVDYVGSIDSTTSAQNDGWKNMNVLTATSFPRLSQVANVFRRFRLKKLKYHLYGKSASTQRGVLGFSSMVDDINGDDPSVNTEAEIKNMEGAISLKGWESGVHVVDVGAQGLKWYNCSYEVGSSFTTFNPGYTYLSLPATAAAGDLSWDVYVEYEVVFDVAIPSGIQDTPPKRERNNLDSEIEKLRAALRKLEGRTSDD